jgi:hypothetical protein
MQLQAQDICSKFTLSKAITPDQITGDTLFFLNFLMKKECYIDAIHFVSHALEKIALIRWGVECVQTTDPTPVEHAPLHKMVADWLQKPDDPLRRSIYKQGQSLDTTDPYYWLVHGIFWSGGSIVDESQPPVFPQESLLPHAISGGVMLAAVQGDGKNMNKNYKAFLTGALPLFKGEM